MKNEMIYMEKTNAPALKLWGALFLNLRKETFM